MDVAGQWVGHLDRNTTAKVYGHFIESDSVTLMASLKLFEGVSVAEGPFIPPCASTA